MNKNILHKKINFLMVIILIFIFTLSILNKRRSDDYKYDQYLLIYTVEERDTIWSIANKFSKDYNLKKFIFEIEEANSIDGSIYPGDKLLIPIYI